VSEWFNYTAALKILTFGLLVGAALPALFGLVLLAVLVGVLFIARDFIGHQTGLYLLGAKPK
jgi:hypothetical protein